MDEDRKEARVKDEIEKANKYRNDPKVTWDWQNGGYIDGNPLYRE